MTMVSFAFAQTPKYSKIMIYSDAEQILQLARAGVTLDDLNAGKQGMYYVLELSQSDIMKVKELGFTYEIIIDDLSSYYETRYEKSKNKSPEKLKYNTPANFNYGSMGGYLTLDEIYAELDQMRELYPTLISVKQLVGEQTTVEGRNLYYVKISDNPDIEEEEPEILYTSLHHAREPQSMQGVIYYMWYLLENYETDIEIKYLIDQIEMYFIPAVNPDGYEYNKSQYPNGGGMWRKNRTNNGDGTFGIDLNRNYGFMWGYDDTGSSPDTDSDVYRGTAAFSEIETQLLRDFCINHDFILAHNHHTYSNLMIIPFGYEEIFAPDDDILRSYSHLMTSENGYTVGTGWEILYTVNGDSNDWMYGEQSTKNKIFAFTQETGNSSDGFWPEQNRIITLCEEMFLPNLYLARFASEFAEIFDESPTYMPRSGYLKFNLKRFGLSGNGNYNVEIIPENEDFSFIEAPVNIVINDVLSSKSDSIGYVLNNSVEYGDFFTYTVKVTVGEYVVSKTFTKQFVETELIISDNGNNMDNWISSQWNTTNENYVSAEYSITDSPYTNYADDANNSIVSSNNIDLTNTTQPVLVFWAKWNIENDWDYAQLFISDDNGTSWTVLEGNYTNPGTGSFQPVGEALYDAASTNGWVKEEIDLSEYAGKNVKFKFTLKSDSYLNLDGFYFDNFSIINILSQPNSVDIKSSAKIVLYPNPAQNQTDVMMYNINAESVQLIDLNGRIINTYAKPGGILSIDCRNLNSGIYFIRILTGNHIYTKKLIVK